MRIGVVAARAGVRPSLIERAQRVRLWLETATGCNCQSIDDCGLFDEPSAVQQHETPFRLPAGRVSAGPA